MAADERTAIEAATGQNENTLKIENTDKRDSLIAAEKKYQREWEEAGLFNQDAPSAGDNGAVPKFYGTQAYPYMNGTLHAGHAFTASKIEFAAGFARMQGKKTLFPQGFHCTGMPIKAAADKLAREVEMFGTNFERYSDVEVDLENLAVDAKTKADPTKFGGTKSKAAAKTGNMKYQFQIMTSLGIPTAEIHKFADAAHWLTVFPGICKEDLTAFGGRVDWRRSMVTTDANPFYDAFVRWQMNRLKEKAKIRFGKRYTVYSPKDGQACLDHDRSSGEGVTVQEYTCVKLRTIEWSERAKAAVGDKLPSNAQVYFVPATLRPETMYGQTCCFVGPQVEYGIFQLSENNDEFIVTSSRAARNMSYQGVGPAWGSMPEVLKLQGSDLVGTLVSAPLSVHKEGIRILPMETVKPTKGTGVVTCVPSDSPDDYATTLALQKKPDFYGIKAEWIDKEIIPIIETPRGNLIAKALYEQLGINSPKDAKLLADAKEIAYKEGFYQGKMCHGEFAGKSVSDARQLCEKLLVDQKLAFKYAEPDGQVISRSGDDCVAAYLDQWYFNYGAEGDKEWYQQVLDYVRGDFDCCYPEAKRAFEGTIEWLGQWACSRSYGLGTKLPWDATQLVESLSDSTIYMAYYTICHILHGDIFGKTQGRSSKPIRPEQMTDNVWDYVFHNADSVDTDIAKEDLEYMRREFAYWYPMDVRVSGKDLINNHLTFALYHHVAMFPRKFWPRSFRVNGHLMLNGQKMSKSTGNFLTLRQALQKYGTDATRLALADAGDGIEDANFEETVANASILRLFELRKWSQEILEDSSLRQGDYTFFDKIFDNDLNALALETRKHYEDTMYKLALKSGCFDLQSSRDAYREHCRSTGVNMHANLVRRFIELQALVITPLAPHWAESVWKELLHKEDSIQNALFPDVPAPDPILSAARDYVKSNTSAIHQAEARQMKKMQKGKKLTFDPNAEKKLTIFVASAFPAWQNQWREALQQQYESTGSLDPKKAAASADKAELKRAMPFMLVLQKRINTGEDPKRVFERQLPFDEVQTLREMVPIFRNALKKLVDVQIVRIDESGAANVVHDANGPVADGQKFEGQVQDATPGNPAFGFANTEAKA
ncbi:leucyl-tRNA synthetase [Xylariomycetidae sp. FL0641]|nr:leucyl-tRNA synthetase [Xylariomycetidae sp. FL0641]